MSVFTRAPTSKRAGSKMPSHGLTAILPCNDLDASQAFYARLGFVCYAVHENYRILEDRKGGHLHLNRAVEDWLVPGRNPFGLYLYAENIDELAANFPGEIIGNGPQDKPWGMYEFALSDPDQTLVRIGWPTSLRSSPTG
jgi:catechol 2,3-dioxygenase-like lactoylglutathione lyase family enzyme